MKRVNKTLVWVGLIFAFVVCLPSEVFASTTTDEVIRTISPDLKNIVLKSVVPSSDIEADYLMNGIVGKCIGKDIKDINYQYYAWCEGEGYTTCYIDMQSDDYKEEVLPKNIRKRLAVEMATDFGWHKYVGLDGQTVTMKGFGASAPNKLLFKKFGFTVDNVVKAVKSVL